jgi:hypothetical protein
MVEKKAFYRTSDDLVASGMDRVIQALIAQTESILDTTQKRRDYLPPEDTFVFDLKVCVYIKFGSRVFVEVIFLVCVISLLKLVARRLRAYRRISRF